MTVTDALELWIKAEYLFRLGPQPYTALAQERLVKAEEELRYALTGERGLRGAALKLGMKVTPDFEGMKVPDTVTPWKKALPKLESLFQEPPEKPKGSLGKFLQSRLKNS